MKETRSVMPVFGAALLLLLPVLYIGSYALLVKPYAQIHWWSGQADHYRVGGRTAGRFFWPLEHVDRKLRPGAWEGKQPLIY